MHAAALRACTKNTPPQGPPFKILPAVLMPSLQYQSSALVPTVRGLTHHQNRKTHPHHRSTNSHVHSSNPTLVMAQIWPDARSTRESSRSAISRNIRRASASAAVVVTGGRVVSGIQRGPGDMPGGSWGCCSSSGCGPRLRAAGSRGIVAGGGDVDSDGKLRGVVRFAVYDCHLLETVTHREACDRLTFLV